MLPAVTGKRGVGSPIASWSIPSLYPIDVLSSCCRFPVDFLSMSCRSPSEFWSIFCILLTQVLAPYSCSFSESIWQLLFGFRHHDWVVMVTRHHQVMMMESNEKLPYYALIPGSFLYLRFLKHAHMRCLIHAAAQASFYMPMAQVVFTCGGH